MPAADWGRTKATWSCAGRATGWDVSSALRAGTLERVLPQYRQPADIYAVLSTRSSQSAKLQVCLDYLSGQLRTGPYALDLDWDNGQPQ